MLNTILKHEGGFVNDPNDRGGATNFGVTQATYSEWLGRTATVDEVRRMDIDTALEIYRANYYFKPRINGFPEPTQPQIFDCAVNHGQKRAIKFVQTIINLSDVDLLVVDGLNGPRTMKAAAKVYEAMGDYFINAIADERIDFYRRIVARDSSQKKFLKGWLNRANSFKVNMEDAA